MGASPVANRRVADVETLRHPWTGAHQFWTSIIENCHITTCEQYIQTHAKKTSTSLLLLPVAIALYIFRNGPLKRKQNRSSVSVEWNIISDDPMWIKLWTGQCFIVMCWRYFLDCSLFRRCRAYCQLSKSGSREWIRCHRDAQQHATLCFVHFYNISIEILCGFTFYRRYSRYIFMRLLAWAQNRSYI